MGYLTRRTQHGRAVKMREVVCVYDFSPSQQLEMIFNGIVPPTKGDFYHVTGEKQTDGVLWFTLSEYPDMFVSPTEYYRHFFEQKHFAEVTVLQQQIDEALKAPKPKESIKTMDFSHLNIAQTKCALAMAKLKLMGSITYEDYRLYRDKINALYLHLQKLNHNA